MDPKLQFSSNVLTELLNKTKFIDNKFKFDDKVEDKGRDLKIK
jgi:hypothetical protein